LLNRFQGFIWAFDVGYPSEGRIMHGGVHNVLKDKVKRETVFLKDDYIVRVEGRASPFNINRMTFFTAKGKQYGPWGDRRSQVQTTKNLGPVSTSIIPGCSFTPG
jgi:hypothetical protein